MKIDTVTPLAWSPTAAEEYDIGARLNDRHELDSRGY
jgi:hypothetical protein